MTALLQYLGVSIALDYSCGLLSAPKPGVLHDQMNSQFASIVSWRFVFPKNGSEISFHPTLSSLQVTLPSWGLRYGEWWGESRSQPLTVMATSRQPGRHQLATTVQRRIISADDVFCVVDCEFPDATIYGWICATWSITVLVPYWSLIWAGLVIFLSGKLRHKPGS